MHKAVHLGEVLYKHSNIIPQRYINGVEWFYHLVPQEDKKFLMGSVPDYQQKFLVSGRLPGANKPIITFAAFDSYLDFLHYLLPIPKSEWNYFEVILGNKSQKFYIDVDLNETVLPSGENLEQFSSDLLTNLIEKIIHTFRNILKLPFELSKNLLIFTSHSAIKKSYHLIVDGYCVSNHTENAEILKYILEDMNTKYITGNQNKKIIDISMYSKIQQLRLFGSQKPNSNRPKVFQEKYYFRNTLIQYDLSDIPDDPRLQFNAIFQRSCVTFTSYCQKILVKQTEYREETPGYKSWAEKGAFENYAIFPTAVKDALKLIDTTVWDIAEINDGLITLRRKISAKCLICDRVHDNENAFVSVDQKMGGVYFYCWREIRTGGDRVLRLGTVDGLFTNLVSEQHVNSIIEKYSTPKPLELINKLQYPGSVKIAIEAMKTGRKFSYI